DRPEAVTAAGFCSREDDQSAALHRRPRIGDGSQEQQNADYCEQTPVWTHRASFAEIVAPGARSGIGAFHDAPEAAASYGRGRKGLNMINRSRTVVTTLAAVFALTAAGASAATPPSPPHEEHFTHCTLDATVPFEQWQAVRMLLTPSGDTF